MQPKQIPQNIHDLLLSQIVKDKIEYVDIANYKTGDVPTSVSPVQIRMALTRLKLRTKAEHAVSQAGVHIADHYEFALEIKRDSPVAKTLESAGIDVDALFRYAATL